MLYLSAPIQFPKLFSFHRADFYLLVLALVLRLFACQQAQKFEKKKVSASALNRRCFSLTANLYDNFSFCALPYWMERITIGLAEFQLSKCCVTRCAVIY